MSYPVLYSSSQFHSQEAFLHNYVSFYRKLSKKGKARFLRRVQKFISTKDFEFFFDAGEDELLVKTLIAASCIQVTWGLKDAYIHAYSYIGVYEEAIQVKNNKTSLYSSVWLTKYIRFSWNKLREGFVIADDGKHIGYFEWTRALMIQAKNHNITDEFFSAYYKVWCEAARDLMFVVADDEKLPLEAYAEKLPVIIQHFFEQPEELKNNHPEIYEHTKILLNIDLLEAEEFDFIYAKKLAHDKNLKTKNRAAVFGVQDQIRRFGLSSGVLYYVLIQFPVVVIIWYLWGRWMYMSWHFVLSFTILLLITTSIAYFNYYKKRGIHLKAMALMLIFGLVPMGYGIISLLNTAIPIERKEVVLHVKNPNDLNVYMPWKGFTRPYTVKVSMTAKYIPDSKAQVVYNNWDNKGGGSSLDASPEMLINLVDADDDVIMHTHTGILGSEVFDGFELVIRR